MFKMQHCATATLIFLVLSDMYYSNAFMYSSNQNILTAIKSKRILSATKNTSSNYLLRTPKLFMSAINTDSNSLEELLQKQKVVQLQESVLSDFSAYLPMVMKTQNYQKGSIVFKKGEKADGFYFVKDGLFQCIDSEGSVIQELKEGHFFGELGDFFHEANKERAFTVQSASENSSLYFVDIQDYQIMTKLKVGQDEELEIILKEEHSEYNDFLQKKKALNTFKSLNKILTPVELENIARTMEAVSFQDGDNIVEEGLYGEEMYFVADGKYRILNVESNLPNRKYFGELGMLVRTPRAETIQAAGKVTLFKLDRESVIGIIDETRLESASLSLPASEYSDASFFDKVKEINDYILVKNRPKKEPVSFHSILATSATAIYFLGLAEVFSPGFTPEGIPDLFDFSKIGLSLEATQISTLLFGIVGITGTFRLPPSTPLIRRHFFNVATLQVLATCMMQNSNMVAVKENQSYAIDLLTINPGSISFWVVMALSTNWTMRLIAEAMVANDKARSTIPLEGKAAPISIMAAFMGALLIVQIPACFLTLDQTAYNDIYVPFAKSHYETFVLSQCFVGTGSTSLYMLFATLLFEKKITQVQCTLLALPTFFPFISNLNWVPTEVLNENPETLAFANYNNQVFLELQVFQSLFVLFVMAAAYGYAQNVHLLESVKTTQAEGN
ncbi:hypothetical protein CTEN210_06267 [Chaetoceros tenuissimus]|uniref:Cyclic nucleotide-binding domain-containing protein n=1 Tax=Chaetoceros tenuissimus TaxID=426638 RepID=A0AAD3CRD7_9STRA|nr:hypothetical protein CTEN210_06267 [Chaetoceros tenuissimus]